MNTLSSLLKFIAGKIEKAPQIKATTISANGSRTLTLPNASKGMIITIGASNSMTEYLYNVTNLGAVTIKAVMSGSNITTSTSTNSATLSNASGNVVFLYAMALEGDIPS